MLLCVKPCKASSQTLGWLLLPHNKYILPWCPFNAGFTFLSASKGINFCLFLTIYCQGRNYRERKRKRVEKKEKERDSPFSFLFLATQRGRERQTHHFASFLLIFGNRGRGREEKKIFFFQPLWEVGEWFALPLLPSLKLKKKIIIIIKKI